MAPALCAPALCRACVLLLAASALQWTGRDAPAPQLPHRRDVLRGLGAAAAAASAPRDARALPSDGAGALTTLRRRTGQKTGTLPSYGLDAPDVFYPEWFAGTWKVTSKAVDVSAPLGVGLFGGNASLAAAVKELDAPPVVYEARWVRSEKAPFRLIADRPYNIASLAAATMGGREAIRDLPDSNRFDPDQLAFRLAPPDAGGQVFRAELRCLARRFEPASGDLVDDKGRDVFDAGELSRQSILLPGSELIAPPSVKDIETINLFTKVKDGRITASQRTATWLVGTEGRAAIRAQAADGRAVDVRTYRVEYERLSS